MKDILVEIIKEIGIGPLLFLVFLALKVFGVIDWSWVWITAPLWISVLLVTLIIIITVIVVIVHSLLN